MSVYKICCKNPLITDVYIGSTTNFIKRCYEHKSACKRQNRGGKLYKCIADNGDWVNWEMTQLEVVEGGKKDLRIRERYWIENLKSSLNIDIPTMTRAEYYIKNKEQFAEYYQKNKEKIAKQMAEYYRIKKNSKQRLVSDS